MNGFHVLDFIFYTMFTLKNYENNRLCVCHESHSINKNNLK